MYEIPEEMLSVRRRIASQYLKGTGLEIGALHVPLETSGASVKYVDRMPVEDLRRHYPELSARLTPVDIVDDGEWLSTILDRSQDFIIANHLLEHTENPLGTIRNHITKLRQYGILYYALPDKRYCFDRDRPLTDCTHLVADDADGGTSSRQAHQMEWASVVDKDAALDEHARKNLYDSIYLHHFHVWDASHWLAFLVAAREYLGKTFDIIHLELNGAEIVSILMRTSSL